MTTNHSWLIQDFPQDQERCWAPGTMPDTRADVATRRNDALHQHPVTLQRETIVGIPILRCSGRIVYGPESERLFDAIRNALQTFPDLILDFQHITMIDAKGIGALLTLHALARSKNGSIRLVHVNQPVERVLRITNLFGLFQLFGSELLAAQAR